MEQVPVVWRPPVAVLRCSSYGKVEELCGRSARDMIHGDGKMGRIRGLRPEMVDGMRPTCLSCMRPENHCLCAILPRFKAQCNILILQHPHERRKYHGTARMVAVAIANARVHRGLYFEEGAIERMLENQNPYILFPGDDAINCEDISFGSDDTVIAIDGTWSEAGKVLHRNPALRDLPRVTFCRPLQSKFAIRKQPKQHCLSTIESISYLLRFNALANNLLEQAMHCDRLLAGFEQMVERQLEYFPRFSASGSAT